VAPFNLAHPVEFLLLQSKILRFTVLYFPLILWPTLTSYFFCLLCSGCYRKPQLLFLPRCMECRRGLAMRILSVRPSVTHVNCDKTVEIYIPYERTFSPVFWEEEWLVGATPSAWNFGSTGPRWSKIADFEPIIARSASAVIPSERNSIDANRKSTTRFPMSLKWSSYVAPKSPKGGLNNAKRPISVKNRTSLEVKSATNFLCVKTVSGKVVKHSLA